MSTFLRVGRVMANLASVVRWVGPEEGLNEFGDFMVIKIKVGK